MGDRPEEVLRAYSDAQLDAAGAIILIPQEAAGQHLLIGNALLGSTGEGILLGDGSSPLVCEEPCVEVPSNAASRPPPISQCLFQGIADAEPTQRQRNPQQPRIVTRAVKMRWLDELLEHKRIGCPVPGCPAHFPSITTVERHYLFCTGVDNSGVEQCPYCEAQFLTHSNALQEHIPEEHPTMKALLHSEPSRRRVPGTYRRRRTGGDADAPAAKRGAPPSPALPPPTSREWEARRRTYSRAWDQPVGPTSELFRRTAPAEEEDPLQLPRECLNHRDITLSSEELALDEHQLVEEVGDHPSSPDSSLLVLDTAALPRVPLRSTVYGGRGRGQRGSRRPHSQRVTVPTNARTLQVIVRTDGAGNALLQDPRLLDALGGLATREAAQSDDVPEDGSSQERVAVHAAAVEGGRYLQTELVERGAVSLRRHEVDRFFGVVKVDSACQTDDLPYRPFARVSPAILKRATPRVQSSTLASPAPAPPTMPKSIAVSVVCANHGYSSDDGSGEDEDGRLESEGVISTGAALELRSCCPEPPGAAEYDFRPPRELGTDADAATVADSGAEPPAGPGPTSEAEPPAGADAGPTSGPDAEWDPTRAATASATSVPVPLGELVAERALEHVSQLPARAGSETVGEPSKERDFVELVEESTVATSSLPVESLASMGAETVEAATEGDSATAAEPLPRPVSEPLAEDVARPVDEPVAGTSPEYVMEIVIENVGGKTVEPTSKVAAECVTKSATSPGAERIVVSVVEPVAGPIVDSDVDSGEPAVADGEETPVESGSESSAEPTTVLVGPAAQEDAVMLPLGGSMQGCALEEDTQWNGITVTETPATEGTEQIDESLEPFTKDLISTGQSHRTASDAVGVEWCRGLSPEQMEAIAERNGGEWDPPEALDGGHEVSERASDRRETERPDGVQEATFSTAAAVPEESTEPGYAACPTTDGGSTSDVAGAEMAGGEAHDLGAAMGDGSRNGAPSTGEPEEVESEIRATEPAASAPSEGSPEVSVAGEETMLVIVENEEDPVGSVEHFDRKVPSPPPGPDSRWTPTDPSCGVSREGAAERDGGAAVLSAGLEDAEEMPRGAAGNVGAPTKIPLEEKLAEPAMETACSWETAPSPGDDEDTRSSSEALHIVENAPDEAGRTPDDVRSRAATDSRENGVLPFGGCPSRSGDDAGAAGSPVSPDCRVAEESNGLGETESDRTPEEAVHFLGGSGGRTIATSTRRQSLASSSRGIGRAVATEPARGSETGKAAGASRKRTRPAKATSRSSRGRRPLAGAPKRRREGRGAPPSRGESPAAPPGETPEASATGRSGGATSPAEQAPGAAPRPKKEAPSDGAAIGRRTRRRKGRRGKVAPRSAERSGERSAETVARTRRKPRFQLNLDFPDGVPLTCSACKRAFVEKADVVEHILHEHYNLARVNDEREMSDAERRSALRMASKAVSRFECKAQGCCASFACHSSYYVHLLRCPVLCAGKTEPTPASRPSTPSVDSEDAGPRKKRRSALRAMETFTGLDGRDPSDGASPPPPSDPPSEPPSDLSSDVSSDSCSSSGDETTGKHAENAATLLRWWRGRFRGPATVKAMEDVPDALLQRFAKRKGSVIRCPKEGCQKEFQTVLGFKYHYPRCGRYDGYACCRCGLEDVKRPAAMLRHLRSCYPDRPNGDARKKKKVGAPATIRPGVRCNRLELRNRTLAYRKEHHAEGLFGEWRPRREDWRPLDAREAERYLPARVESPALRFSGPGSQGKRDWVTVRLFEVLHRGSGHHTTLFAGGSVWASAWCPTDGEDAEQWAALACCPDPDAEQPLDGPSCCPRGLLQLWSFGCLRTNDPECEPRLALLVGHDWGPVTDLAWCPSGCWEPAGEGRRLGLLAAACGDGHVRIFGVPHETPGKDATTVYRIRPGATLASPPGTTLSTRLAWDPARRHAALAVGYGDGLVAVFDLETASALLRGTARDGSLELRPRLTLRAHLGAVTGLAWHHCTRMPLLATASIDRSAKLWNLQDTAVPVTAFRRSLLRSLATCQHWNGLFLAGDDTYTNSPTVTVYKENGYFNFLPKSLTAHNSASWWTSVSEWLNAVAACDVGGRVAAIALPSLARSLDTTKKHGRGRLSVYRADAVPLDGRRTPLRDAVDHADAVRCLGLCFADASLGTWKRVPTAEESDCEALPSQYPLNSINTVCWNPNGGSPTWLLSGGQAGIVRVSWVGLLATSGKRTA